MFRRGLLFSAIVLHCLGGLQGAARAAMSEAEVRRTIERQFGVKVLKIQNTQFAGKRVFLLTVMSAGGDTNEAFQVNRLAVDPETGRLVSAFRHRTSGYDYAAGAGERDVNRQPTDVLRQGRIWR